MSDWFDLAKQRNHATKEAGRWRRIRDLDGGGPEFRTSEGRSVVSFASNDYLGLSQHRSVIEAAKSALDRSGAGSGSARLIVGARSVHRELEEELADWKHKDRAVLFPNGFAANLGVLTVLGTGSTLICSDELNHASIVDGCRMARAETAVYPHRDIETLDRILTGANRPAIVVTDSVFSMDGDVAPIDELTTVCEKHSALLILDEAHAVLGPHPTEVANVDRLRVGTLSKFLGALGGFVACDEEFADLLINEARPFIFTTAGSPADAAAALAALRVLRSSEGDALIDRLRANIDRVRPGHPSPIVPIVVGDEDRAIGIAHKLEDLGYLVPAIRPPSVPLGTSRLRITLSAAHTDAHVEGLMSALDSVLGENTAS